MINFLRKAPTALLVTVAIVSGVVSVAILAGYVAITLAGAETGPYARLITDLANVVMVPLGGVSAVTAVAGARTTEEKGDA